jgi:hypothetical protein
MKEEKMSKTEAFFFGMFVSLIATSLLYAFLDTDNKNKIIEGKKIVYGHAVYQCEKKQELDLK